VTIGCASVGVRALAIGKEGKKGHEAERRTAMDSPGGKSGNGVAFKDGNVLRALLVGFMLCGIGLISVSLWFFLIDNNIFAFIDLLARIEGFRPLLILFMAAPLFAGVWCIVLTSLAIKSSKLDTNQRRGLDEALDKFTCHFSHDPCVKYCGSTTRGAFRAILISLLILFGAQMSFAVSYLLFLKVLLESVDQGASGARGIGELEEDISALQLSMFNLCCFENGWSAQGEILPCDEDGNPPATCGLTGDAAGFEDVLCTCYRQEERYAFFVNRLNSTKKVCEILSNAVVTISDKDQVPGTDLPVAAFVDTRRARIVAFNGPPELDSVTVVDPKGFGCGFGGYARAFQWMQFQYIDDATRFIPIAVMIITVLQFVILAGITCHQSSAEEDEFFDEMVADIKRRRVVHSGEVAPEPLSFADPGAEAPSTASEFRKGKDLAMITPMESPETPIFEEDSVRKISLFELDEKVEGKQEQDENNEKSEEQESVDTVDDDDGEDESKIDRLL